MPTSSFDTYFACTILLAAALISTGFLCSTMQTSMNSTQGTNKASYLKSIADHIITSPGSLTNWGSSGCVPTDFGLAASPSTIPYELDVDKISMLNSQNSCSLSYFTLEGAAKLNVALGITVSQLMSITIEQLSNTTIDDVTSFTFTVLSCINSEPVSATVNSYVVANNYLNESSSSTSAVGVGYLTVTIPIMDADNAMLIVFARASFDDRITSYAIYNFASSTQEAAPSNDVLILSPLNYMLSAATNSSELTIQNAYIFSYSYQQNLTCTPDQMQWTIPNLVDKSPFILVVNGFNGGSYFQEWVSYPQIPFHAGSSFSGSEQNVFSYTVTIKNTLYNVDISLGGLPS